MKEVKSIEVKKYARYLYSYYFSINHDNDSYMLRREKCIWKWILDFYGYKIPDVSSKNDLLLKLNDSNGIELKKNCQKDYQCHSPKTKITNISHQVFDVLN